MPAVLNEAMRIHPAAPGTAPRTINENGDTIAGYFIPPGVSTTQILKQFRFHLHMSCYRPMLTSGFGLHSIFLRTGPSLRSLSQSDGWETHDLRMTKKRFSLLSRLAQGAALPKGEFSPTEARFKFITNAKCPHLVLLLPKCASSWLDLFGIMILIAEESIGWDKRCKCYIAFEKGPLYIRLKPRK